MGVPDLADRSSEPDGDPRDTGRPADHDALTHPMTLGGLIAALGDRLRPGPALDAETSRRPVRGVQFDSRVVTDDEIWAAVPGQRSHGADHAEAVRGRRLAAVLTDPDGSARIDPDLIGSIPLLLTDRPRPVAAEAAAIVAGRPADRLRTFAVTATNGKTTTTHLLATALRALGHSVGLIGTNGFSVDGEPVTGVRSTTVTTPESVDLHRMLAAMLDRGATAAAMEVSSHALALDRVEAITYDVAAFGNLGVDHLDFHHDLADYFAAKARLFEPQRCRTAVINLDDDHGRRLLAAAEVPTLTVAIDRADQADLGVVDWQPDPAGGSRIRLRTAEGEIAFALGLPGRHNVANAVLALGMVAAAGLDVAAAASGLATARVSGRMELVSLTGPSADDRAADDRAAPLAVIDFAHTPQAVLAACQALDGSPRPLIVVVGSGGDRDPSKRAPIGSAAAAGADIVVVTDDNPRTEDPALIRAQIDDGAREAVGTGARARTVIDGGDRRSAIRRALELAAADTGTVLVLGRGHETHQQTADGPVPFVDAAVVAEEWAGLTGERR